MLCAACQDIFSSLRKLAYSSIYRWQQTPDLFRLATQAGCHLCNLILENRSEELSLQTWYSFKPLNCEWARHGTCSKWYAYQGSTGDAWTPPEVSMRAFELDPTPNKLGTLLATDVENIVQEAADSSIVLEFYSANQIVLPMELSLPSETDPLQALAQKNLASQTSTGQPETLHLAQAWLQNCLDNHPSCGPRLSRELLPPRLLDVGSIQAPLLRLVSGASLDSKCRYVALSRRRDANKAFPLNSSNLAAYQTTIPTSDISNTVRDAVEVTRALGIRYLWADSMCIIQDDDSQNRAHEVETIAKVFAFSTCALAAANSGNENDGIFAERNPYRVRPCRVPNPFNTDPNTVSTS